jgi:predicted nuclease with TOPRIM domain
MSIKSLEARVSLLNKKVKEKQSKLTTLKKQKMFYEELANLLDFAEFDQYKWANLVQETVIDAKKKGLDVTKVENQLYNINYTNVNKNFPDITKRMDIAIEVEGKYKNFIYYLYNYENRKELIRVKEMKITSPSTFYVKFSIYGYNR